MTTQNWPNEIVSGWPLNPEQDGWHWLRDKESGGLYPCKWFTDIESDDGGFWDGCSKRIRPHIMALTDDYIGPILTPTQISEMLAAERERAATAIDHLKNEERGLYATGLMTTRAEITIRALASAADEIRNLGTAP